MTRNNPTKTVLTQIAGKAYYDWSYLKPGFRIHDAVGISPIAAQLGQQLARLGNTFFSPLMEPDKKGRARGRQQRKLISYQDSLLLERRSILNLVLIRR